MNLARIWSSFLGICGKDISYSHMPGTLEELGMNFEKILAKQNLARPSWHFIYDLENIFSGVIIPFQLASLPLSKQQVSLPVASLVVNVLLDWVLKWSVHL